MWLSTAWYSHTLYSKTWLWGALQPDQLDWWVGIIVCFFPLHLYWWHDINWILSTNRDYSHVCHHGPSLLGYITKDGTITMTWLTSSPIWNRAACLTCHVTSALRIDEWWDMPWKTCSSSDSSLPRALHTHFQWAGYAGAYDMTPPIIELDLLSLGAQEAGFDSYLQTSYGLSSIISAL